jgi:hypothetical protein
MTATAPPQRLAVRHGYGGSHVIPTAQPVSSPHSGDHTAAIPTPYHIPRSLPATRASNGNNNMHNHITVQQRRHYGDGLGDRNEGHRLVPPSQHPFGVPHVYPSSLLVRGQRECSLCCTPISAYYECEEKHTTCSSCLAQYILNNWRDSNRNASEQLRCCHQACKSRPLTTAEVVRLVTDKEALVVYIDHTVRLSEAQCYSDAHAVVLAEAPEATAAHDALFQKHLAKSLHRARMCPHCKFGPMDFFGCDDLSYHHGERREGGGQTNNACPRCGFFASDVSRWQRWDGTAQDVDAPVAQWQGSQPLVDQPRRLDHDDEAPTGAEAEAEALWRAIREITRLAEDLREPHDADPLDDTRNQSRLPGGPQDNPTPFLEDMREPVVDEERREMISRAVDLVMELLPDRDRGDVVFRCENLYEDHSERAEGLAQGVIEAYLDEEES